MPSARRRPTSSFGLASPSSPGRTGMGTTRFTDGNVTVTLDGDLEALVRRAVEAAGGETLRVMEAAAEEVAAKARAEWYADGTGVKRETGKGGDIQVVTTVRHDEVRVSVGSTDLARAKYVHRPGRLSVVLREISREEYAAEKAKGGSWAAMVFRAARNQTDDGVVSGHYYQRVPNPHAADGKYLLPELVTKPMRLKVKAITPELGKAIAARATRRGR